MSILVDVSDLDRFVADLRKAKASALPHAMRKSINTGAFEGRKQWVRELPRAFVLRNRYTERSLRVVKATGVKAEKLFALLGSTAPHMRVQEKGGKVRGRSVGAAKPIPTAVAAGQAMSTRPRTRQVRRPNWLRAIKLAKTRPGSSRAQRNAIAINEAVRRGRRFVLLELNNLRGIFRVTGRKRLTVRLLYNLSKRAVMVKPSPTLQRTLNAIDARLPHIYAAAVHDQLRRHKVLGY